MATLTPEAFVQHVKTDLMNGNFCGPTIVGVRGEETIMAILDPSMPTVEMRCQALRVVGADFIEAFALSGMMPIDRVMIAREAWSSTQEEVPPSQDPNRQETLVVSVADFRTEENYVLLYDLVRTGEVLDLVLRHRLPAARTDDQNMKALMEGMMSRLHGKRANSAGLHVHRVDMGKAKAKDLGSKQQN